MRLSGHILCTLVALLLNVTSTNGERLDLRVRQEDSDFQPSITDSVDPTGTEFTDDPTSATDASDSVDSSSESDEITRTRSSERTDSSRDPSPSVTVDVETSSRTATSTTVTEEGVDTSLPTASNVPLGASNALPLQPKITPALAIAAVILILSGVVYTIIGIRKKWMQIFFSMTLLTSLSITVLVVYLMKPPVSDAVQGAYLVAAFFTGVIFGALALIFREVTEGLGCMLGGFCIAMWFLCLRQGGLIHSSGGRAIFIGVITFVAYSLSFSRYTRTYGLIGTIAFAGATATVLGIDCVSRAGLKELWLYLWNLNDDIFPLGTTTYPITRGIKVELAGTVLIFLIGVMSQIKLWKLIQERRSRKEADRRRQEENLEKLDSEVGRRVEDDANRDRVRWEAVYGDRTATEFRDSGIDSSTGKGLRSSVSVKQARRSAGDSMEMVTLGPPMESQVQLLSHRVSKNNHTTTTIAATEDGENDGSDYEVDGPFSDGNGALPERNVVTAEASEVSSGMEVEDYTPRNGKERLSIPEGTTLRASTRPPRPVISVPFAAGTHAGADGDDTRRISHTSTVPGALAAKHHYADGDEVSPSSIRYPGYPLGMQEPLVTAAEDDDGQSSVAATFDELDEDKMSLPDVSRPASSIGERPEGDVSGSATEEGSPSQYVKLEDEGEASAQRGSAGQGDFTAEQANRKSVQSLAPSKGLNEHTGPRVSVVSENGFSMTKNGDIQQGQASVEDPIEGSNDKSQGEVDESRVDVRKSFASHNASEMSRPSSLSKRLSENLPEKLSKVAITYRTNEWAKYLENADQPEPEELARPDSPGIMVEYSNPQSPVVAKSEKSPELISAKEADRPLQEMPGKKDVTPNTEAHATSPSVPVSKNQTQERAIAALSRNISTTSIDRTKGISIARSGSHGSSVYPSRPPSRQKLAPRGSRADFVPLVDQTLVESPIERLDEEPSRSTASLVPQTGGVRVKRGDTLKGKHSSTSPMASNSSGLDLAPVAPGDSASLRNVQLRDRDPDNISLTERKQFLQQQQQQQRQPLLAKDENWPLMQYQHLPQTNSHQPRRTSGFDQNKQQALLANWRASVRASSLEQLQAPFAAEDRRAAMINDRKQARLQKEQEAKAANLRESMFDDMMRRGDMLDLHKEAMRRMQAKAKTQA